MLDRDILTAMLAREGASAALIRRRDAGDRRLRAAHCTLQTLPRSAPQGLPRARGCCFTNCGGAGFPAGLVTGNLTRIGWTKMERAGFRRYLRFGAFAEMARDRAGLVGIASATRAPRRLDRRHKSGRAHRRSSQ